MDKVEKSELERYDELEENNEKTKLQISYPSGKLGAITRKKNNIDELLIYKTDESLNLVGKYLDELKAKIVSFNNACESELKESTNEDDAKKFSVWVNNKIWRMTYTLIKLTNG
jgi:hypothetical protein